MPNASQRITDTTIKGMNSMFFMFNSFDERVNISYHPKFHVVINNVSRLGDNYNFESTDKYADNNAFDPEASLSVERRI